MGVKSTFQTGWNSLRGIFGADRDQARIDAFQEGIEGAPGRGIVTNPYPPPYQSPQDLDPYGRETNEMMLAYQRLYASEPALQSAIDGKVAAVASLDVSVLPADEASEKDKKVAEFIREAVANTPGGWSGLIESIIRPGFLCGYSVTEKWYEGIADKRWSIRLRNKYGGLWAPRRLQELDPLKLRLQLNEYRDIVGVVNTRRGAEGYSPDRVLIYTHRKLFGNPYGRSDGRSAYRAAMMIENAYTLWHIAIKNYAAPFVSVKTNAQGAALKALQEALKTFRAGGFATFSPTDEIQLLNFASAASFQAFESKVRIAREEIYLAVRGAFLPFVEGSQGADARGDTSVHKVASDAIESLLVQSACEVVNQQLIPDLTIANYGPMVGIPTMTLGGTNWQETLKQLEVIEKVEKNLGRPVSTKLIYKVSQQEPPRDEGDGPPPPQQPAMGPAPGGGFPFGAILGKDGSAELAEGFRGPVVFGGPPGPPPHPGLVWKESTSRWVLPQSADGAGYKPQSKPSEDAAKKAHEIISESHNNPSMKLVHEAFVGAATGKLDATKIANAAAAMKTLNMHQLRALKTFYGVGGTTSNKDPMVSNILDAVKGSTPPATAPKPQPKGEPEKPTTPIAPLTPEPKKSTDVAKPLDDMPAAKPKYDIVATSIGGSTGAVKVKDGDGNLYVRKDGSQGKGGVAQLKSEEACNAMYRVAGVAVPASAMYGNEKLGRWVDGQTLGQFAATASPEQIKAVHAELQKGFAADCLFANYDVIGLSKDNVVIDKAGKPHRIDNGGSLTFRAQGGTKPFTADVTEIAGLRNPSLNPSAASVYGSMTDKQVAESILQLKANFHKIEKVAPDSLSSVLEERMANMTEWANEVMKKDADGLEGKSAPKPTKPHSDKGQSVKDFKAPAGFAKQAEPNEKLPDSARPTLTKQEAESLMAYTGSTYHAINGGLRNPPPTSAAAKHIEVLKEAFARAAPFDSPVTVHRGLSDKAGATEFFGRVADAISKNNGFLEITGFISTTTSKSKAFVKSAQIEIEAIHGIDARPYSSIAHEDELLLPHEAKFEIVSYQHKGPKGVPYVKLRQLPPSPVKK
jgi:hypothetical protein